MTEQDNLQKTPQKVGILWKFSPAIRMTILILSFIIAICSRIFSVIRFEAIIHEFDPWFNYRAVQYLDEHGRDQFYNWFDAESWHPYGRQVGYTVFPGLMYTAVMIARFLRFILIPVNIRYICVFCAPLFSMFTCLAAYGLSFEITHKHENGLFAALFMAIIPSYISRSEAGSFDNEAIAITLLLTTFYFFIKSANTGSIGSAIMSAITYAYLVSAWGGYSFIIAILPTFVLLSVITKKYDSNIYIAYTVFYAIANILAIQVKYIDTKIFTTSEHLLSHIVFAVIQLIQICELLRGYLEEGQARYLLKRMLVGGLMAAVLGTTYALYSGSTRFTSRVMTLLDTNYAKSFIPIIASVSEHQPTPWATFFFDSHFTLIFAILGLFYSLKNVNLGKLFIVYYLITSVYFASIMIRLQLVAAPALCVISGIGVSELIHSIMLNFFNDTHELSTQLAKNQQSQEEMSENDEEEEGEESSQESQDSQESQNESQEDDIKDDFISLERILQTILATSIIIFIAFTCMRFMFHGSIVGAEIYSNPTVILFNRDFKKATTKYIIDDFREGYQWLRQNTKEDAKVLAWWDYGYQLAGFTNRTTITDNNTWNHQHIALVGKLLASSEEAAIDTLEKLNVDYVVVVFGGKTGYAGDDINKFLWILRIAANEFPYLKEQDYTLNGYTIDERVSPALKNSIMYKLCYYRFWEEMTQQGKGFDMVRKQKVGHTNYKLQYFEEVFTTQRWLMRIYRLKKRQNREDVAYQSKGFEQTTQNSIFSDDDIIYLNDN